MRLAIVVQRYGTDINGGAELHARYIAEHLSAHADVRVMTTCARDYLSWRNEHQPGADMVNGVPVERFPVVAERDLHEFRKHSERVFHFRHSLSDELSWLDSEGPRSPALIARLREMQSSLDFVLLFSLRYYHAYYGARAAAERAILVPTAERDPALGLGMFRPVLRGVRAIMYNSPEEQALLNAVSDNGQVPGAVVGIGSEIPSSVDAQRARQKFGLKDPFVIYVGRIDASKGCGELFELFQQYLETAHRPLDLVLIGNAVMPIPEHPRIRHLGFVTDQDKFDAIAGAEALVMPSYYESLSMVALEAWALGRPVLANARCDVLVGQCLRSNAGLYYENQGEFAGALNTLLDNPALASALGRSGREYFACNYSWPVIEQKYLDMFERLSHEPAAKPMEPLPGWLGMRRRELQPAASVVDALPSGPAVRERSPA